MFASTSFLYFLYSYLCIWSTFFPNGGDRDRKKEVDERLYLVFFSRGKRHLLHTCFASTQCGIRVYLPNFSGQCRYDSTTQFRLFRISLLK